MQTDLKASPNNLSYTPNEEHKLSDKPTQIPSQPSLSDPALNFHPTKFYKLVSQTSDWRMVSDSLEPLSKGKLNLIETVKIIGNFIKRFDPNPDVNTELLTTFLYSLPPSERSEWEKHIFPGLAAIILRTLTLFPEQIPILVQNTSGRVKLSKEQCLCLLAHMFMCVTVDQENKKLPKSFSFSDIFTETHHKKNLKLQKLYCMFNYFRRALKDTCKIPIILERLVLTEAVHGLYSLEAWKSCNEQLGELDLRTTGKISEATDSMEVAFANRFFGGSALRAGAAQEQILMLTGPEMFVGILLCECMGDREAILVRGSEIYSAYTGHLDGFTFKEDYKDNRPMSTDGIVDRDIIAIDGLNFKSPQNPPQFSTEAVLREINKAYVGFCGGYSEKKQPIWKGVSTGKWGCGAFMGNAQVKMMVQWIAASRAKRELWFYTFGNEKDLKGVEKVMEMYKGRKIGELVEDLVECCRKVEERRKRDKSLFDFMIEMKSK